MASKSTIEGLDITGYIALGLGFIGLVLILISKFVTRLPIVNKKFISVVVLVLIAGIVLTILGNVLQTGSVIGTSASSSGSVSTTTIPASTGSLTLAEFNSLSEEQKQQWFEANAQQLEEIYSGGAGTAPCNNFQIYFGLKEDAINTLRTQGKCF